jgi:hypothetical protein
VSNEDIGVDFLKFLNMNSINMILVNDELLSIGNNSAKHFFEKYENYGFVMHKFPGMNGYLLVKEI